ncbi:MAG: ATP-binding cassette domain-containing protein [Alphaproteobacteria bacterium]|nr:ATP-binding cassette domain-containing protein [Alphaproteobacteria bacterium]
MGFTFTNLAISVTDLRTTYVSEQGILDVLNGISLSIPNGQIFGIIGRSGAGKSTLLRCLNGLEKPLSGKIYIQKKMLGTKQSHERRKILHKIGTVFQHFNLLSRRTVLQNIALPLEIMGISPKEIKIKARKMADLVGLSDKYNSYPNQLSGGQCQRVAIARAIVSDVTLLLCDEFTSSLDPETALEILSLLRDLNQRLGITIVLVTHDMSVIREICDQVCVLDDGKVVEIGTIESILLRPQHPVTKSLISHLFTKDLPRTIHETLHAKPLKNDHAVLRLMFSGKTSSRPTLASAIQKFKVPLNIIAGNLGHIQEVTCGSMIVTLPLQGTPKKDEQLPKLLDYFQTHGIAAEILGYIPQP